MRGEYMDNFVMVPSHLINSKIPRSAMLLLGILNSNARQLGYAYGTNKYYAKQLGCSTRTITNLLKYLADNNYITIINGNSFKRRIYVRNKILIT